MWQCIWFNFTIILCQPRSTMCTNSTNIVISCPQKKWNTSTIVLLIYFCIDNSNTHLWPFVYWRWLHFVKSLILQVAQSAPTESGQFLNEAILLQHISFLYYAQHMVWNRNVSMAVCVVWSTLFYGPVILLFRKLLKEWKVG